MRLSSVWSKFAKILMSFFKHKSVLLQILRHSSLLWHNSPVLFLVQTWYTFDKISTSKCKFSDLPLLALKITKSIFGTKGQLFLKLCIIFRVMRHNSSVLFIYKFICFVQKETNKVKIFIFSTAHMKIYYFFYSHFKATSLFFF